MIARYVLDTDICIYIARRRPAHLLARFESLDSGEAVISVITWGELRYGAEKSAQREHVLQTLDEFAGFVPVQALPHAAGRTYGAIRANLEARGRPIGNNDLWIAAHARTADLTLVTNNEREFRHVPDLRIQNWAAAGPDDT